MKHDSKHGRQLGMYATSPGMRRLPVYCLMLIVTSIQPVLAQTTGEPLPTTEQLHTLLKDGEYQLLLQNLSRVLALRPDKATSYDRGDLYLMRGEAQLHLQQTDAATLSFTNAAKALKDPSGVSLATATAELAKKSPGLKYTPKTSGSAPIDILDETSRKSAFESLYSDESAAASAEFKAAAAATSLQAIFIAIKDADRLQSLEHAATGKEEQTAVTVAALAGRAQTLMTDALAKMTMQVNQISETAHSTTESTDRSGITRVKERGLDASAITALKEVTSNCDKISQAANDLDTVSKSDTLKPVMASADRLKLQVQSLSTTVWTSTASPTGNKSSRR